MSTDNSNTDRTFDFPVGYEQFHKDETYNFQLNRFYSFGYAKFSDMVAVGKKINSTDDWENEFMNLAETCEKDGKLLNAAFYYRASEFYIPPYAPRKMGVYEKFKSIVDLLMCEDGIELIDIPYENSHLPCLRLKAKTENKKGDIVMHGGFDSYKEEFYSAMIFFANRGYDIVVFDGPGQGEARKKYDLEFDYRWEKPTSTVIDYFGLDDVILLGVSMGGYLCFRAASFEKRIKGVIASSIAYDYTDHPPKIAQPIVYLFYNIFRNYTGKLVQKEIDKGGVKSWYFSNLMYMLKAKSANEAVKFLTSLTAEKLHCENITQDVLILTGYDDRLSPFKMHKKQIKALVMAKSVTDVVFKKETSASHHCQIGNMGLNFNTMLEWIEKL